MNYSEALSFTFRDPEWGKKMVIGGLLSYINLLTGFLVIGYYVGIIRNVHQGRDEPLPDWADMSKIIVDGIMGLVIVILYFVIIGGLGAIAIVDFATDHYMGEAEMIIAIVLTTLITAVAMLLFISFGLLQFAVTGNFSSAFNLSDFAGVLKSGFGDFIAIIIFSVILNLVLFCAGMGLFSPFLNFWGTIVQAHLFGQFARNLQLSEPAIQAA